MLNQYSLDIKLKVLIFKSNVIGKLPSFYSFIIIVTIMVFSHIIIIIYCKRLLLTVVNILLRTVPIGQVRL